MKSQWVLVDLGATSGLDPGRLVLQKTAILFGEPTGVFRDGRNRDWTLPMRSVLPLSPFPLTTTLDLAGAVRFCMSRDRVTHRHLAERANVSTSSVAKVLRGEPVMLDVLFRIANAVGARLSFEVLG